MRLILFFVAVYSSATAFGCSCAVTTSAHLLRALPSPEELRQAKIDADTNRLTVTLTLEHREYLPGEAASVTIAIHNPTFEPLEVWEPFNSGTGTIYFDDPSRTAQGNCWCGRDSSATRLFAPNETIERTFDTLDFKGPSSLFRLHMPEEPGVHTLQYSYGGSPVKFRVLQPRVELITDVPLVKPGQYTSEGKTYEFPRSLSLVVLEAEGVRYIAISRFPVAIDASISTDLGKDLSWAGARSIEPIVRILGISEQIISIKGVADVDENITVTWISSGALSTIQLGTDRKPR